MSLLSTVGMKSSRNFRVPTYHYHLTPTLASVHTTSRATLCDRMQATEQQTAPDWSLGTDPSRGVSPFTKCGVKVRERLQGGDGKKIEGKHKTLRGDTIDASFDGLLRLHHH